MKDYLTNFPSDTLRTYATIIVIFTYNVLLGKDVDCTCKEQTTECDLFMALPFFIVFILILWMDKMFRRTWKYTWTYGCQCCCISPGQAAVNRNSPDESAVKRSSSDKSSVKCRSRSLFLFVLIRHMMKAVSVGLLWVASVLIDGDWYICCKKKSQLLCKDKTNITAEEQTNIAQLKNSSKVIGFILLLCIILVAALMSLYEWRKCCQGNSRYVRKVLYEKLILEEEEKVLEEILRKAAKEKLTEEIEGKIRDGHWDQCYSVADELIERHTTTATTETRTTSGTTAATTAQGEEIELQPNETESLLQRDET